MTQDRISKVFKKGKDKPARHLLVPDLEDRRVWLREIMEAREDNEDIGKRREFFGLQP